MPSTSPDRAAAGSARPAEAAGARRSTVPPKTRLGDDVAAARRRGSASSVSASCAAVGVDQRRTPARSTVRSPRPTGTRVTVDRRRALGVVADVADPDLRRRRPGPAPRRRSGSSTSVVTADRPRRRRVDGEDPAVVPGVVDGHHQAVVDHQPAGLDDRRVREPEDRRLAAISRRRGGTGQRSAAAPATAAGAPRLRQAHGPAAPPSRGPHRQVRDQVVVLRARCRVGAAPPVRTARSRVLRGVCWLSTNSTTSTR